MVAPFRSGPPPATSRTGFPQVSPSMQKETVARERSSRLERAKGIEPSYATWEAAVLPLNYARNFLDLHKDPGTGIFHIRKR
jgi:hypothetical protein